MNMILNIEILAPMNSDVEEIIFSGKTLDTSKFVEISNEFSIKYEGKSTSNNLADGLSLELIEFSMQFLSSAASGIIAAWLYDVLKGRANKIWINDKEAPINKKEISKIIDDTKGDNK